MSASKAMQYKNLPEAAQAAARRIAKRTGETPEEVARRTSRAFLCRGAVYRERKII